MEKVQVLVTMNDDGSFEVAGPIQNKALCFAVLEGGKQALRQFDPERVPLVRPVGLVPKIPPNGG
jgi:hypothetical protein